MTRTPLAVGFLFVTLLSAHAAQAGVLRVGDGTPQSCTPLALETAIASAANNGGGLIRFRCGTAPITISLADTLTIPSETTIDGEGLISLAGSGQPVVLVPFGSSVTLKNLTFPGPSLNVAIWVEGTLTLMSSALSHFDSAGIENFGTIDVTDSTFSDQRIHGDGIQNYGIFRVQRSVFMGNLHHGISNAPGGTGEVTNCQFLNNGGEVGGGAIMNSQGGSMTVSNSVFAYNGNTDSGGAIANDGTLDISDSFFFANHSTVGAGAIYNGGTLTLTNSQLTDNTGRYGGAISNGGDALIERTFLVGNSASESGGGIVQFGIGTLTINKSVIRNNTATNGTGGGIFVFAGSRPPTLNRTTVTNNAPDDIAFQP